MAEKSTEGVMRLPADERFVTAYTEALASLREVGTYRTLERWLSPAS